MWYSAFSSSNSPLTAARVTWRHVVDGALQFLLQNGNGALQALLLRFRQLAVLLRVHHAVAVPGGEAESGRRAHQRDALVLGALADRAHPLLLSFAEFRLDLALLGAIFGGLERGRDSRPQILHQARHVLPEPGCPPGGQLDGARLVRRVEIEYVAPIGRRRAALHQLLEMSPYDRAAAEALGSHREQVVAIAPDADPELDCIHRARLAEDLREILQLVGRLELELVRIAAPAEIGGRQRAAGIGMRGAHVHIKNQQTLFAADKRG